MTTGAPFREAVMIAAASLRSSKLRSFLTLLGIILATATLIAVMSVIRGMDVFVATSISNMGADGFRLVRLAMIGDFDPKKYLELMRRNPEFSVDEFEFIKDKALLAKEVGMELSRSVPVRYGGNLIDTVTMRGQTANMALVTNVEVATGRFLTDMEDQKGVSVAFIGEDLRVRFFEGLDPIGKTIYVSGRPFRVVGVAKSQGSMMGQSRDNFLVIPVRTFSKMYGARRGVSIYIVAADHAHFTQSQDEVRMLLRAYRGLKPKDEDNFSIYSSDSLLAAWNQLTGVLAATAVAIVSVFMVVGGVVIMNIMLAVVTERTREIGIRKSVGASRRDILSQFLVESSMLSATGGLIGVLLAWIATLIVKSFTSVPMAIPYSAVFVGVGLSAAVGLFFGIYPARRAAMLSPIVALRAEK
jgi:putative ABC transport system permease protein